MLDNITNELLNKIDLTMLSNHLTDPNAKQYFLGQSGYEHYKLLAYIASHLKNNIIVDIGTYKGASALALSYEHTNKIFSFDISNNTALTEYEDTGYDNIHKLNNINFVITPNCTTDFKDVLLGAPVILLDVAHDGVFENIVYKFLVDNNYKGLLLLDDIHLNQEMETFWNSIMQEKNDITKLGHWSGTGAVFFNC